MGCGGSKAAKADAPAAAPVAAAPAKEEPAAEAVTETPIADVSTWYIVEHTMEEGEACDSWWATMQELMGNPEAMQQMVSSNNKAGYFNHAMMPCSKTLVFCIWQCSNTDGATEEGLQTLLDTQICPVATNKMHKVNGAMNGGQYTFANGFEQDLNQVAPMYPSAHQWWVVKHEFKEEKKAEWWNDTAALMGDQEKYGAFLEEVKGKGLHNHFFYPMSDSLAFCLWEGTGADKADALNEVLGDGAVGRGCMDNTCYPIAGEMTGGMMHLKDAC